MPSTSPGPIVVGLRCDSPARPRIVIARGGVAAIAALLAPRHIGYA